MWPSWDSRRQANLSGTRGRADRLLRFMSAVTNSELLGKLGVCVCVWRKEGGGLADTQYRTATSDACAMSSGCKCPPPATHGLIERRRRPTTGVIFADVTSYCRRGSSQRHRQTDRQTTPVAQTSSTRCDCAGAPILIPRGSVVPFTRSLSSRVDPPPFAPAKPDIDKSPPPP